MRIPEYGRNVLKMVNYLKTIEDRDKRNEQARAVLKVMEILNPAVHTQDDYENKLWDHLHIIADFDLDVDSPYPVPDPESLNEPPLPVAMNTRPVRAAHYGRNIENIIDMIAQQEDGDAKSSMIRSLAVYMRQQYLTWNKDAVSDETIFNDIETLSDFRIRIPEEMRTSKIDSGASFQRQGMNQSRNARNQRQKNNQKARKQHNK